MKGTKINTHSTINDVFPGNFEYRAIKTSIPLDTTLSIRVMTIERIVQESNILLIILC